MASIEEQPRSSVYSVRGQDDRRTRRRTRSETKVSESEDPWALPETVDTGKPWSEMSGGEKVQRVLINLVKVCVLLGLLYMFICSLDFLSSSFRLLGGKLAGEAMSDVELLSNPVAGLMLGILATVLVQSSSTSTSIIVSMVSSGLLPVRLAIPIIMGTNIGTTITNVLVSLGQIGDKNRFRRAFAGATLNDMFNWLTVIILLPLEAVSGYLYHLTGFMVQNINSDPNMKNPDLLKALTKPLTGKIIEVDTSAIDDIAINDNKTHSLIKICCHKGINSTCIEPCDHLFMETTLTDIEVGAILLVMSLVLLCTCLVLIVKLLGSILRGAIAKVIQRIVNADFPGHLRPLTGYFVIVIGAGLTFIVQSSSILTATLTPLVGIGVIKVERVFPIVLGANIGTTFTSMLAALASDSSGLRNSLQISLSHLMFNVSGIFMWFVIWPARRLPIKMAKFLGGITADYRWFPIAYIVFMFFLFPLLVFSLSMAGWKILVSIAVPILLVVIAVVLINVLQKYEKTRSRLPKRLQSWDNMGIPLWMRSLRPYDDLITRVKVAYRERCKCCKERDLPPVDLSCVEPSRRIKIGRKFMKPVSRPVSTESIV